MRKHAATIALVVLAVGLGVWLWLDRDRVTEGERKRRENNVFVAWRRPELTQITIVHEGETVVLRRERTGAVASAGGGGGAPSRDEGRDGVWRMTSPREERVDPMAVERLLTTLEFATVARKVTEGAALGLEAPRATGAVQMGSIDIAFALGAASPRPEGSSYFRTGNDAAVVVSKELVDALLAPSDTYRDRTVVPYLATDLARIEVQQHAGGADAGGGFTLERIDERSFRVASSGVLASRTALEKIWAALAEMRAETFAKDADVERLTRSPVVTLKLVTKDGARPPAELVIGEACPGHPADVIVLRKAPSRVAACAPKDVVGALLADAESLVEKHPFALRMDEMEEVRFERGAGAGAGAGAPEAFEIARKGAGFHMRAPADRDLTAAEAEAATELLTRIAGAEASSVTRGAGAPFAAIGRVVVRAGEHEQVVEIGAPGASGRAVLRRVIDDARLDVDASVARRLMPRATSLRPRTLLEGESRRVTRVLLRCGTDQELVDRGEGLRLVSPPGYETDGSLVQLVEAVTRGKIDTWVADRDDGTFGFADDGCRVILGFEDGNAPVTLSFGSEGEGGVYARIEPRGGVLVAPRALRELAGRIFVNRGALRSEAAAIESVRVTSEGRVMPPGDPAKLRDAVASLVADEVLAIGKDAARAGAGGAGAGAGAARVGGAAELVIEVSLTEGGAPRRISCRGGAGGKSRVCSAAGVAAAFAVGEAKLSPFLPGLPRAAGATRDAGTTFDAGTSPKASP